VTLWPPDENGNGNGKTATPKIGVVWLVSSGTQEKYLPVCFYSVTLALPSSYLTVLKVRTPRDAEKRLAAFYNQTFY